MTTLREAAQQALDAMEQSWLNESDRNYEQEAQAMNALRAALNAPPPEPVGWVYIDRATGERTFSRHMAGVVNHTEVVEVPVYAEPPRREWRGLTDEEVEELQSCIRGDHEDVRMIEAALRERNA